MKVYTTYQGACRAAREGRRDQPRPILRILDAGSADEVYLVLDGMDAVIYAHNTETRMADGSITFMELSTR